MSSRHSPHSRVRRTVNDLVMAEMFLVQARMESATVIGNGFAELRKHLSQRNEARDESVTTLLQRIADEAVEPYFSRYEYFRDMLSIAD